MIFYITGILIILAGVFNAIMDLSSEGKFSKPYWNKCTGWKNKWKTVKSNFGNHEAMIRETKKKWYYLWVFTPSWKEKFPYSSTALVWVTDGWHLAQILFHTCWQLAVTIHFPNPVITFIFGKIIFSFIFERVYKLKKD